MEGGDSNSDSAKDSISKAYADIAKMKEELKFYRDSSFPGSTWIDDKFSLHILHRGPSTFNYEEFSRLIERHQGRLFDNSEKSMSELETDNLALKRNLQINLSRRDVYLAIWKSAPYLAITLLTAIGASLTFSQSLWQIPTIILLGMGLLGLYSWRRTRVIDNRIAFFNILVEEIQSEMKERLGSVKSSLKRYLARRSENPISTSRMLFFDRFDENTSNKIRTLLGDRKYEDVEYKHNLIVEKILEFEKTCDKYRDSVHGFDENIRKQVMDIDRTSNIQIGQPTERIPILIVSILVFGADQIRSIHDFTMKPKYWGFHEEVKYWIEAFISEKGSQEPYKSLVEIATSEEVSEKATEVMSLRDEGLLLFNEIGEMISYVLDTSEIDSSGEWL
jgi:hypothetical protein